MTKRESVPKHGTTKKSKSIFRSIADIVAELRKVVWLSRREVAYLTVVVLAVSIVAGLFLGTIDYAFSRLVEVFLLK